MSPPRLTDASADRLQAVAAAADDAVDAGAAPDPAIAKAARDHALPVGHVPLVVRAFNTGRAVRQLGEADPWAKAAAYPQATVEGVLAVLQAPPAPPVEADLSDYHLPPGGLQKAAAAAPRRVPPAPRPTPAAPQSAVKAAADNTLTTLFAAAAGLDALTDFARRAPAGEYVAVKAAAARAEPAAAAFVFGTIEADHPVVAAKTAHAPDPAVRTGDHPAVAAVAGLAALRARTVVPDRTPPPGWRKLAGASGWLVRGPHNALLGLPVPPPAPPPPAAPTPRPLLTTPAVKAGSFGTGFRAGMSAVAKPLNWARTSQTLGPTLNIWPGGAAGLTKKQTGALDADLRRTDEQAAVQELLADQRFRGVDPKVVVSTFRQLHSLAPRAVSNPAVAADFIHRRIQTGPLSYYDLQALTTIEKNLAAINRPDADQADD